MWMSVKTLGLGEKAAKRESSSKIFAEALHLVETSEKQNH